MTAFHIAANLCRPSGVPFPHRAPGPRSARGPLQLVRRHGSRAAWFPRAGNGALVLGIALVLGPAALGIASPTSAANPGRLSVGDPSPRLELQVIGPGTGAGAPPEDRLFPDAFLKEAPFLVVTYWSTWCPSCRAGIALDEAAGESKQILRIAVSPEDPEGLREFVTDAGWTKHVIAVDGARTAFRDLVIASRDGDADEPVIPYTCIVGSPVEAGRALASPDPRTEPVLLWCGRTAAPEVDAPRSELERVLAQIAEGRFDVREERTAQEARRECAALLEELGHHVTQDDLNKVMNTLEDLESCPAPTSRSRAIVAFMNEFAWAWATREGRTQTHLVVAESMCRLAMKHGGERDPYFLDTYAKVLHDLERRPAAIAMQRRAVEAVDPAAAGELRATLDAYLEEAGLPPSEGATPAPPATRRWTLNGVWDAAPASKIVVVHPDNEEWANEAKAFQERFFPEATLRTPDTLAEEERGGVLVLYGAPDANRITREVLDRHGIALTNAGVRVGTRLLEQSRPVLITAVPNPWNETLPACIYTALEDADAHNANRIFHGPTSLVVGTWDHGEPKSVYTLDFLPDSPSLALQIGESLTATQARSDLAALSRLLQSSYAGFADLDWSVARKGSSWAARDEQFGQRLEKQGTLSWVQFYELVREYLADVQDTHFAMRGTGIEGGRVITRTDRLVATLAPYFADVRAESLGAGLTLVGGSDASLSGTAPVNLEIVPTPHAVRARQPYLFPTLPALFSREAAPAPREFLIGMLADPRDPPTTMRVRLRDRGGKTKAMDLPLHRGRVPFTESEAAWKVRGVRGLDPALESTALAILSVRTMVANRLQGMGEAAAMLRKKDAVVLDLRANSGGSDQPAMEWCQRFSGQPYEWVAAVIRLPGPWTPLQSTLSIAGRSRDPLLSPEIPRAPEPYRGRLFVLWDHGTASSGETFSHLAAQVQGAVSVGENSAGCVSYGNLEEHSLPESGIQLTFGRSRFVVDWVRPVAEGVGLFPDYWLDTSDPVAEIERALEAK